jgi:hypothetical protein
MAGDVGANPFGPEEQTPPLQSLGGETASAEIATDLQRLSLLPNEALEALYQVLGPLLGGEMNKERINRIAGPFCKKHGADIDDLVHGIAAARTLLRHAAREDLHVEKFVEDLELLGVEVPAARALVSGYQQASVLLRAELMMSTLMDHGAVLKNVDWRIDQMRGSNRGKNLNAPVASITFNYQDGQAAKRLTLQVLPPVLKQLREILNELLVDGSEKDNG